MTETKTKIRASSRRYFVATFLSRS